MVTRAAHRVCLAPGAASSTGGGLPARGPQRAALARSPRSPAPGSCARSPARRRRSPPRAPPGDAPGLPPGSGESRRGVHPQPAPGAPGDDPRPRCDTARVGVLHRGDATRPRPYPLAPCAARAAPAARHARPRPRDLAPRGRRRGAHSRCRGPHRRRERAPRAAQRRARLDACTAAPSPAALGAAVVPLREGGRGVTITYCLCPCAARWRAGERPRYAPGTPRYAPGVARITWHPPPLRPAARRCCHP